MVIPNLSNSKWDRVYEPFLKRPFDFCFALLGLILSTPLWFLIAIGIWLEDGRPIFYFQERVGKGGKIFKAWKFRSMVKGAEAHKGPVAAKENDPRISRVGKVLRNTAMDELPQLINILKGDMSFVGPRPDRPWEVEEKDGDLVGKVGVRRKRSGVRGQASGDRQGIGSADAGASIDNLNFYQLIPDYQMRLLVRPGLTGLAQVYAKYDTPRRQKLRFDLLYIRNMSFWLDLKLILLSILITMRGKWEARDKKF